MFGRGPPPGPGGKGDKKGRKGDKKEEKKKWQPPKATRIGKKKIKKGGLGLAFGLPGVRPNGQCKLRVLRKDRIKDFLMLEEEYLTNQAALKVCVCVCVCVCACWWVL
jgi:26S proteasome regulatory subunit T2